MRVVAINLDRRPDRWESVQHSFSSHGIQVERFSAVDARDLMGPRAQEEVFPGILACWRSHENLLAEIAEGPDEFVLIIEDDAVPSPGANWTEILSRLPGEMTRTRLDYLQLGFVSWQYGFTRPGLLEMGRTFLYRSWSTKVLLDKPRKVFLGSSLSGTHAYVVTRRFAQSMESLNTPCWTGADGLYMRLASRQSVDGGAFPVMARLAKSIVEQVSRTSKFAELDTDVHNRHV